MATRIAVASGKGGTGKTTVAVNLAYFFTLSKQPVQYIDCDVEEPNGHIFLKPELREKSPVQVLVPAVDQKKCNDCGECGKVCQYHAIINLPGNTLVFEQLCHSCGLCVEICPEKAIHEEKREIGYIEKGEALEGIQFVHGVLNISEPMAVPLIHCVKKECLSEYIQVIDAPPGTSCPVVKTIADCDCVVMVTEPTPFGLHDLTIAVSVAKNLGKPVGIVINRKRDEYRPLADYLKSEELPVLAEIPETRAIAEEYAKGNLVLQTLPLYIDEFTELVLNMGRLMRKSL